MFEFWDITIILSSFHTSRSTWKGKGSESRRWLFSAVSEPILLDIKWSDLLTFHSLYCWYYYANSKGWTKVIQMYHTFYWCYYCIVFYYCWKIKSASQEIAWFKSTALPFLYHIKEKCGCLYLNLQCTSQCLLKQMEECSITFWVLNPRRKLGSYLKIMT